MYHLTKNGVEEATYSGKIILENQINIQSIYTSFSKISNTANKSL